VSVEVIAFLAWTVFVAWVVFLGGAGWLEDTFLGALLLRCCGIENLPSGGIKTAMAVIWLFSAVGFLFLR